MPRPKNHILLDLWDRNDTNQIVCNNGNCKNKILNSHSPNLERHLKKVHPDLYANYIQLKSDNKRIHNIDNLSSKNYVQQKSSCRKPNSNSKTETAEDLNRANIELAIVELFTKNGRPLDMVKDRAFKILVKPVFDALGVSVNQHNIIERIIAFSLNLKQEIIKALQGKLLSLKIDAATRQNLGLLAINVQFIENKSIQIKTLALKELKSKHTSEYLTAVILEVLKEYEIDINQILTITTDHGHNMLKSVKAIKADYQNTLGEESDDYTVKEECVDDSLTTKDMSIGSNNSSQSITGLRCDDINTSDYSNSLQDQSRYCIVKEENIDNSLSADTMQAIQSSFSSFNVTGVRCGAHTLQLCVYDIYENLEIKNKLQNCRAVVNTLRTQTYLNILNNSQFKKPILGDITSWCSTFDMLEMLWQIKDTIEPLSTKDSSLYLSTDIWNFVIEFIAALKPIYGATIRLQTEQLYFSELYIILMDIIFQVESLPSNELTTLLVDSLNKRKAELFDIELFNAAVFLDPRIKICMNAEQKERAKKYITGLYQRMNSLKEIVNETIDCSIVKLENMVEPSSNCSLAKSFSEFLQNLDTGSPEHDSSSYSPLEADFILYERQSRLPLDSNIMDYWSTQNNALSVIADIILAIPVTQISMERVFSALKYMLYDRSNRLSSFHQEHLQMVRVNGIFNYENE